VFLRGKKDGCGEKKWPNGVVYTGRWKDDFRSGIGVLRYSKNKCFEGTFLNNLRHGYGTMKVKNEVILEVRHFLIFKGIWESDRYIGPEIGC
jgi:hypothetical protein